MDDLKFFGCGAAFYPALRNTNAFFLHHGNLVLIDCGESTFERIMDCFDLSSFPKIDVFITHLHADHVGSLASLISYAWYVVDKKIRLFHPNPAICDLLSLMGIERDCYEYDSALSTSLTELTVTAIPVPHVPNMTCYGYVLEDAETRIYYSGDAADIPSGILSDFLNGKLDRIYQDTASVNHDYPTHCSIHKLETLIPLKLRSKVYCMHFDSECRTFFHSLGFQIVNCFNISS